MCRVVVNVQGVSFERQPSPPHGFSRDARIAQGLLEDPHFLPYHATLGLEQKRVELLHKAQRLTTYVPTDACVLKQNGLWQAC